MGITEARKHLALFGKDKDIIEFDVSSATVSLAAKALGTDECLIAKSLSFMVKDNPVLIITSGNMKIDNPKFKHFFGCKAQMLSPEEVKDLIGHEVGGVCPFGIKENVIVYLDNSLKQYDYIYPACGSSNSCIKLSCQELEKISGTRAWIDVCKIRESQ